MKKPIAEIDTQGTRERILHAASEIFASEGYQQARLAEIARRAGVSRSTLYEHFTGKDELLIEINHLLIASSLVLIRDTLSPTKDARTAIRVWLKTAITPAPLQRNLLKIMYSDEAQPNLMLDRDATLASISEARKWIRKALRRGIESGEFYADLNVSRTAYSLQNLHSLLSRQAVVDYPLFHFGTDGGKSTIELLLRGICVSGAKQTTQT
jgi:AcrR family transcriptional regulator